MICPGCGKPIDSIDYWEKGRRDCTLSLDGNDLEIDGSGALLVEDFAYEHECGQKLPCMNDREALAILKETDEEFKESVPAPDA